MNSVNPIGKTAATSLTGLYVFFQTADYPTSPSYMIYDSGMMKWSVPITLTTMALHDQENAIYHSDPKAVYFNNQIYLFGRGPDNSISGAVFDGENWSTTVLDVGANLGQNNLACNAVTPYVWNAINVFIFWPGADHFLYCVEVDPEPNAATSPPWVAGYAQTIYALDVVTNLSDFLFADVRFNSGGLAYVTQWKSNSDFAGSSNGTDISLVLNSSSINCLNSVFTFYQGNYKGIGRDGQLYVTNSLAGNTVLPGINIYTAPSAVVLDDDGTTAYIAVFYVEDNDSHNLKAARLVITLSNGIPTYQVAYIQDTGVAAAPQSASPCGLLIS